MPSRQPELTIFINLLEFAIKTHFLKLIHNCCPKLIAHFLAHLEYNTTSKKINLVRL